MIVQTLLPRQMLRRLLGLCVAMVAIGLCGYVGTAHAGYAAIVVDPATGEVLDAVNADQQNYPASLTKMMTLYLAFQAMQKGTLKADQMLPISGWAAAKAPTKLGLRAGRTISVNDCILGMVTKSANDAATVVAESLGGSERHFADMMNAQAALLGMSATHFDNASGLPDPANVSTARDMAKLSMALYRDFPQYTHYFSVREFVFHGHIVRGHNNLMYRYPGMDGLKTGFTDASGFNLASTAVRDGRRLFAVVLGGRTAAVRDRLMARLLDDGFDHRPTPDTLVAQAGIGGRRHHFLAALSPISTAEAADTTLPAAHRRCHHRSKYCRVVARKSCVSHKGVVCPRHERASRRLHGSVRLAHRKHHKKPVLLASNDNTAPSAQSVSEHP